MYDLPTDIATPPVVNGRPAAGKRVRATTAGWEDAGVYHALFLPENRKRGKKLPVIVEYAGNAYANPSDISLGTVEDCHIGYSLSSGEAIWVCLPYIDVREGYKQNCTQWWGDVEESVRYCIATLNDVCRRYGGDRDRVVLAGFSRGAIGCFYIGLHDDSIASLWAGFFCHSHFDGVIRWNYEGSDRASARIRLQRLNERPVWISQEIDGKHPENGVEDTQCYLQETGIEGNFTFATLPYPNHTTRWLLCDLPVRAQARQWWNHLIHESISKKIIY